MTDRTLGASMDNVLAWRLGEACNRASSETAGDYIDRGLALRKHLEDAGFGIVQLDPASALFGGRGPSMDDPVKLGGVGGIWGS